MITARVYIICKSISLQTVHLTPRELLIENKQNSYTQEKPCLSCIYISNTCFCVYINRKLNEDPPPSVCLRIYEFTQWKTLKQNCLSSLFVKLCPTLDCIYTYTHNIIASVCRRGYCTVLIDAVRILYYHVYIIEMLAFDIMQLGLFKF